VKSASKAGGGYGRWVFGAALVLLMLFTLFPFYWAIVASFTSDAALFRDPSLWPQQWIFDHYRALFTERDFITPIRNSLIVAGTTTLFCLTVGTLAAYALARIEFRGKPPIHPFQACSYRAKRDLGGMNGPSRPLPPLSWRHLPHIRHQSKWCA